MKKVSLLLLTISFLLAPKVFGAYFIPTVKTADLLNRYQGFPATGKIHILIVPGHEPDFGGAEYRSLKERDMNLELSLKLADLLKENPHYDVVLARDENGWNPMLSAYFDNNMLEIKRWVQNRQYAMKGLLNSGLIQNEEPLVYHNTAPGDVALRLYGINKWSRERGFDLLIHVHFNDYPRPNYNVPGKYRGFAVYVPDTQYPNASTSEAIAQNIYSNLLSSFVPSNLKGEDQGIVHDQSLIALGAADTLDIPSVLIEYGYIYRFADATMRHKTIDKMARLTAEGVDDFFNSATTTAP